mgnify:CR=1 FL=1
MKDVGAFFYFENEGDEMRCVLCNSEMVYTREENGEPYLYCWYCEEDAKDPDPYVEYGGYKLYYTRTKPYTGGMEPRSVFPLMDELEAEWGVADD